VINNAATTIPGTAAVATHAAKTGRDVTPASSANIDAAITTTTTPTVNRRRVARRGLVRPRGDKPIGQRVHTNISINAADGHRQLAGTAPIPTIAAIRLRREDLSHRTTNLAVVIAS
jgi:hypothetical protein